MKVRVGIIGTGFGRKALIPAVLAMRQDAELVGIASSSLGRAREVAGEYGIARGFGNWRELIESQEPDLVCIATPPSWHARMTAVAFSAGCHVLCEKPMAIDAHEARQMVKNGEEAQRLGFVNHELRFNPSYRKARELISAGLLGAVRHVTISSITSGWGSPASKPRAHWSLLAPQGGGILGATGSHHIDTLCWWLGQPKIARGHLTTSVGSRVDPETGEPWEATADDVAAFTLTMSSGAVAAVFVSAVAKQAFGHTIVVVGSEGTLRITHDDGGRLFVGVDGHSMTDETPPDLESSVSGSGETIWQVSTARLVRTLIRSVAEGESREDLPTFGDGLRTQYVMDSIRLSSGSGEPVGMPAGSDAS